MWAKGRERTAVCFKDTLTVCRPAFSPGNNVFARLYCGMSVVMCA